MAQYNTKERASIANRRWYTDIDINMLNHPQNKDLVPMSCDILKIEFYLIPGTIILVDGRKANVEFLIKNLKRNWIYKFIKSVDQHILYLNEAPWGPKNLRLLKYYRKA